jgi:HAD superfamily hydrolase (TIGR01509 family)
MSTGISTWPAAIVFDFDGVIVNSEPIHFAAFEKLFADLYIPLTRDEYYAELIGFDDHGVIDHVLSKHRQPADGNRIKELAARKLQIMRELLSSGAVPALPGAAELVRSLAKNYPLAICSGAVREEIQIMLGGVGLTEFFPIIVSAEDVTIGKPNPMGYLQTTKLLGAKINRDLSPADILIIEDAPTVIESVKQAGFKVLAVATSYPIDELQHADWRVKSLEPAEVLKQIPAIKL